MWVTAHGLLPLVDKDRGLVWAGDAIRERVAAFDPHASCAEVVKRLSDPGVSRVLVQERSEWMPEGVITDVDLAASVGIPAVTPTRQVA